MLIVVGYSRSGTTMMGRILGQNPKVHTFGELHFFEQMVESDEIRLRPPLAPDPARALVERLLTSSRRGFFASVDPDAYAKEATEIIAETPEMDAVSLYRRVLAYETARANAEIPCEQTPRYIYFLSEILQAMPETRVVFLVRDPRDVLISQANKWRRRSLGARNIPWREALRAWANYHPAMVARLWSGVSRLARRHHDDPRFLVVRFEDLLADPGRQVRAVAAHMGLEFTESTLEVPQIGSSSNKDAPDRFGINPTMAYGWRKGNLGPISIALCEWVAGPEMIARGYALSGRGRFPWIGLPSLVLLVMKMSIALPINLSRTKNLGETLRRRFGKGT